MPSIFALLFLAAGIWIATKVRAASAQFMLAFPHLSEHAGRERVACWFQLVFGLLLALTLFRGAAHLTATTNTSPQEPIAAPEQSMTTPTGSGSFFASWNWRRFLDTTYQEPLPTEQ